MMRTTFGGRSATWVAPDAPASARVAIRGSANRSMSHSFYGRVPSGQNVETVPDLLTDRGESLLGQPVPGKSQHPEPRKAGGLCKHPGAVVCDPVTDQIQEYQLWKLRRGEQTGREV